MNKISFLIPWKRAKRASRREVGPSRRGRRFFVQDWFQGLELRQLLAASFTTSVTFSNTIPVQTTDYTLPLTLPKFDTSLGTLEQVNLSIAASGTLSGTVSNDGADPETLSIDENINVGLFDNSAALLGPNLTASQTFTDLAGGATGTFGPFSPSQSASAVYTSGTAFDDFNGGPGTISLSVQTNTQQSTAGGGGNISAALVTTAGATATVTYVYLVSPVTVSGYVYEDAKGTGTLASGDPAIPGTTLTLLDANGAVVGTTTTAANGTYSFTTSASGGPLLAGTYTVVETQPAGFLQGSNTVGTINGTSAGTLTAVPDVIAAISLLPGQDSIDNNFGEVLPVSVAGVVYDDADSSGTLDAGDLPIPDTTLTLLNASGSVVATMTTNDLGYYDFSTTTAGAPLPPGTYTVVETQPVGFLQGSNSVGTINGVTTGTLTAVPDVIAAITLTSGQQSLSNNFGEVQPVTLSGTVYNDQDHSGSLSSGDTPIGGVRINLFDPTGLVATTTTDVFGNYSFTTNASGAPLPPDTYTIVELQPAGYLQGTNTIGTVNGTMVGTLPSTDVIGSIILTSDQASIHNNFGELTPTVTPPIIPPLNITTVQRFGVHLQPTLVVITFDTPLDPATAQDVAHYQIFGPTDSKTPALVPIQSATYNPATDMVTLRLGERLNVHHPYRLTVNGLTNAAGGLLVGSNGVAGGSYVTTLNRSVLSGFTDIYGNFIPINHGKLYPAAIASGYQLKRFVAPTNLGSFAAVNKANFLAATESSPETPPIKLGKGKK